MKKFMEVQVFLKSLLKDKMQRLKDYYEPYELAFLKIKSQTVTNLFYFRVPKIPIHWSSSSSILNRSSKKEQHGSNTCKKKFRSFKMSVSNWTKTMSNRNKDSLTFSMSMSVISPMNTKAKNRKMSMTRSTFAKDRWMQNWSWWRSSNGRISNRKEWQSDMDH